MTDLAQSDRLQKLDQLRAAGIDPYPPRGVLAEPIRALLDAVGTPEEPGPRAGESASIAGRLLSLRDFGKLIFAPVLDRTGRMQIALRKNDLADWWPHRKLLDGGDLIGATGTLGHTQKGQPTLWVSEIQLLAKAIAAPPEKWHGLTDLETRYRRRYVDLWAHDGVREVFEKRSKVLSSIRRTLEHAG